MVTLSRPDRDFRRIYHLARSRFYSYEKAPLFKADWSELVFHHFKVDPEALQVNVPFDLDLFRGSAYCSLVGFKTSRMFVNRLGEWTRWMHHPISHHCFLNVRTYVKHRGEPGIYFIKEYVDSLPAIPAGRCIYGLPYVSASVAFDHRLLWGKAKGAVATRSGESLRYQSNRTASAISRNCECGSLDEFLVERYSAFTCLSRKKRVFRILHEPWEFLDLDTDWLDTSLLEKDFPWFRTAKFAGSGWSAGAFDVKISRPRILR
ncbi:MAG: DUF2071 domain-containing protein [Verrucomicrobiae bacterium]|nr:DUF2071 domain-containing protein [Verrucomicrobiae bacterium]